MKELWKAQPHLSKSEKIWNCLWMTPLTDQLDMLQFNVEKRYNSLFQRRKWQPTPVFLPGESQGQGSLVGCRLWGRTESDTTEAT